MQGRGSQKGPKAFFNVLEPATPVNVESDINEEKLHEFVVYE